MKPTDSERILDALAAQALRAAQDLPEGSRERAAAERVAFERVRAVALTPSPVDWRKRFEDRAGLRPG